MKILFKVLTAAALTATASSCSSFLDINKNPNNFTAVTADNILATALTTTAFNYNGANPSYNPYANWAAVYWGKSGVVSGYGEEQTYNYSNNGNYSPLFNNTYDNLNDYQLIQNQGAAYPNHAAIARIMKVYNYLLLVDEFGDIPYSNALQGTANTAPSYDKQADIYKDFIVQLDGAITDINAATNGSPVGFEDVVFGGNMTNWKKFANSLKLRILMRESSTGDATLNAYVATQLTSLQSAADGFIATDVVVQPGYAQNTNQQNPFYNRFGYSVAGTSATERQYQIPTQFILNQYLNNKDPRLTQDYFIGARGPATAPVPEWIGAVQGESSSPLFTAPIVGSRFLGSQTGSAATSGFGGFFKGLNAPTIIMMVAEQLFLKAEAENRGLFAGGDAAAKADFQSAIAASFQTTYRTATGAIAPVPVDPTATSTDVGVTQYQTYVAANTTNGLVNWDATTTTVSPLGVPLGGTATRAVTKQEKLFFQKYLAMNIFGSIEGWDDYRRVAYPKIPASTQSSLSARPDGLPTRLLYPLTETNTNKANVPANVTNTNKIFWDVVD